MIEIARVQRALRGVNIVEIVEDFFDLMEPCEGIYPFVKIQHEESQHPDCFVDVNRQLCWCRVCSKACDALRFMMNQGLNFEEALEYLERRVKDE